MKRTVIVAVVAAVAMLASVPVAFADNPQLNFRTHLSGDAAGTDSAGQGQGIVRFTEEGVYFKLNVANIENVTMAHIHVAETPGGNGPPVLWLYPEGPPAVLIEGRVQGTLGEGVSTSADLVGSLADLEDLRTAILEGRAYINVHTTAFPGGEIRGQF